MLVLYLIEHKRQETFMKAAKPQQIGFEFSSGMLSLIDYILKRTDLMKFAMTHLVVSAAQMTLLIIHHLWYARPLV